MGYKIEGWGTAVFLLLGFVLAACALPAAEGPASEVGALPMQEAIVMDLPDLGEAPEFRNEVWLNSDGPVTLADQRGKVVLLKFWTFG